MGITVSCNCWDGAVGALLRWRLRLAEAALGRALFLSDLFDINDLAIFRNTQVAVELLAKFPAVTTHVLLHDGDIPCNVQRKCARELETLAGRIPESDIGHGHIAYHGGHKAVTLKFAKGLRKAHKLKRNVVFTS